VQDLVQKVFCVPAWSSISRAPSSIPFWKDFFFFHTEIDIFVNLFVLHLSLLVSIGK